MTNKNIVGLYSHFKDTNKKLKIVCDWDEVIQPCEPYALWKATGREEPFTETFNEFWSESSSPIAYSLYGSKIEARTNTNDKGFIVSMVGVSPELLKKQQEIKNSPNFYQEAPFLTIAEDLLKLIKEDKIGKLIFLSAYDKRKFPNSLGDERKRKIFVETFCKIPRFNPDSNTVKFEVALMLIPFDSESQGQTKADWIKENASDFDLVIDDNPNICKSLVESEEENQLLEEGNNVAPLFDEDDLGPPPKTILDDEPIQRKSKNRLIVITPYYPAVENQHHSEVLLIKNEVSGLEKRDFKN